MPWDSDKSTASDPDNPTSSEQLTADEWDNHVADQKNRGYNSLTTVTGNHTASTQEIILADASGGALTVTLPTPDASTSVMVKKTDATANAVTVATPNTETIDGDSSRTITGENVTREIVSDGTNYFVLYSVLDSSDSGVVDADVNNSSVQTDVLDIANGSQVHSADLVATNNGFSGSGSISESSLPQHDLYILHLHDVGANDGSVGLRIEGDSGANYDKLNEDGTTSTGASEWRLTNGVAVHGHVVITGTWGTDAVVTGNIGAWDTGLLKAGRNSNVSSPLTQFTLLDTGGSTTTDEITGSYSLIGIDIE